MFNLYIQLYSKFPLTLSHIEILSDASAAFENIVTKGEIAQNKQFLLLPQCFHIFSVIIPSFVEFFPVFAWRFSDLVHVGMG